MDLTHLIVNNSIGTSIAIATKDKIICSQLTQFNNLPCVIAAYVPLSHIDTLTVIKGPGSMTGTRMAMAFMRTMRMLGNLPCCTISTFDTIAYSIMVQDMSWSEIDVYIPYTYNFAWNRRYTKNSTGVKYTEEQKSSYPSFADKRNTYVSCSYQDSRSNILTVREIDLTSIALYIRDVKYKYST